MTMSNDKLPISVPLKKLVQKICKKGHTTNIRSPVWAYIDLPSSINYIPSSKFTVFLLIWNHFGAPARLHTDGIKRNQVLINHNTDG